MCPPYHRLTSGGLSVPVGAGFYLCNPFAGTFVTVATIIFITNGRRAAMIDTKVGTYPVILMSVTQMPALLPPLVVALCTLFISCITQLLLALGAMSKLNFSQGKSFWTRGSIT